MASRNKEMGWGGTWASFLVLSYMLPFKSNLDWNTEILPDSKLFILNKMMDLISSLGCFPEGGCEIQINFPLLLCGFISKGLL